MADDRSPARDEADSGDFWVFAYGSLMWRPGFPYLEAHPALLRGYHRSMCILSHVYRGTPEHPGLVAGLDRGGSCRGLAFRVAAADRKAVIAYLDARELINNVYKARWLGVEVPTGTVAAYTFVADRRHEQYAGHLPFEERVALVLQGHGEGGTAVEYLQNTVHHLDEFGIAETPLHHMLRVCLERQRKSA